jgi:hypothetical protein
MGSKYFLQILLLSVSIKTLYGPRPLHVLRVWAPSYEKVADLWSRVQLLHDDRQGDTTRRAVSVSKQPSLRNWHSERISKTNQPTNSTEQNPFEKQVKKFSARNPKVHCGVHKNPTPVPILSQTNPIHTLQPYFPKIYFNIILSCTSRFSSDLLSC